MQILVDSRAVPAFLRVAQGLLCGQEAFSDQSKWSYQEGRKGKKKERKEDLRTPEDHAPG